MANKTQVSHRKEKLSEDSGSLRREAGGFAHDLLALVELQSRLFMVEVREVRRQSILPSLLMISGLLLGASCFPIALIAFALCLAQWANLSIATSFLFVLVVGLLSSLLLLFISSMILRKRSHLFRRSQEEFLRNYVWFKSAFKGKGATP